MNKKTYEKEQAIKLRENGYSIDKIASELNISKSSASIWVRHIPQPEKFTKEFKEKEKQRKILEKEENNKLKQHEKDNIFKRIDEHINSVSKYGISVLKSERIISGDGRWMIPVPEFYNGKTYIGNRYVYEHRVIVEKDLGRLLTNKEVIHHINGDKLDNRLSNLEIMDQYSHGRKHAQKPIINELICNFCGKTFNRKKRKIHNNYKHQFCCLSHAVSFQQNQRWEEYRKNKNITKI